MSNEKYPPRSGRASLLLAVLSAAFSLSLLGSVLALFADPLLLPERALVQSRAASTAAAGAAVRRAAPG